MGFPDASKEYDTYPEYRGYRSMSFEQASREASRLIERDGWFAAFNRLAVLRDVMRGASNAAVADPDIVDMFSDKFAEREAIADAVRAAPALSDLYP